MNEALTAAILAGNRWVNRFNRREYPEAFQEYKDKFSEACFQAVQAAGEEVEALAKETLDAVEAEIARQRLWNRSTVRTNGKLTLVLYLTPMLLEQPEGKPFAKALRDEWNVRRPKDSYQIASFQTIKSGFHNTILGIPIPEKPKESVFAEED